MSNVINMAAHRFAKRSPDNPSFHTVRKRGKKWHVMLVTPVEGDEDITTAVAISSHREVALAFAEGVSDWTGVPFKIGRAARTADEPDDTPPGGWAA
ncbi:MAG: hypothetical protein R3E21_08200 [Caenibius sp.]